MNDRENYEDVENNLVEAIKVSDIARMNHLLNLPGNDVKGRYTLASSTASSMCNIEVMEELVKQSFFAKEEKDVWLWSAASRGQYKVVKFLLQKGADVNFGGNLYFAILNNHVDVVRLLLQHGLKHPESKSDFYLQIAIKMGNLEMIRTLFDYGVSPLLEKMLKEESYPIYYTSPKISAVCQAVEGHEDPCTKARFFFLPCTHSKRR